MNQTEFIKNELLGSLYFNLEKSNPKEFEKLDAFELQYLNNGCEIYKDEYMNNDYEIHTHIFGGGTLEVKITCEMHSKTRVCEFYKYEKLHKKVVYDGYGTKHSMKIYNSNEKVEYAIEYPINEYSELRGVKYIYTKQQLESASPLFKVLGVDPVVSDHNKVKKITLTLDELIEFI